MDRSLPYSLFKKEAEEISKHKWIESEKAGKDIGIDMAITTWVRNHKKDWISSQMNQIHPSGIS